MNELKHQVLDYIILVFVFRAKLILHFTKNLAHMCNLFVSEFKHMVASGLKHFILTDIAKLTKEVMIENAINHFRIFKMIPFVWDEWI